MTALSKQARRRQKCASEGRCPHCGKPCAPYYECEERRVAKRLSHLLRRMRALGIDDIEDVPVRATGDVTRRLPRLGNRPIDEPTLLGLAQSRAGANASAERIAIEVASLRALFRRG